jgi:hypothetical protein
MHYNIQIHIQRVDEPEAGRGAFGHEAKGERRITEVLKLAVTADTEQDAYAKAHRMLTANEPNEGMASAIADRLAFAEKHR